MGVFVGYPDGSSVFRPRLGAGGNDTHVSVAGSGEALIAWPVTANRRLSLHQCSMLSMPTHAETTGIGTGTLSSSHRIQRLVTHVRAAVGFQPITTALTSPCRGLRHQ